MTSILYEISSDFEELFNKFEEIYGHEFDTNADGNCIDDFGNIITNPADYKESMLQAWYDTLEGIECEFEIKAENLAAFIKNLIAESTALEIEEKNLKFRKEQKNKQINNLKSSLKCSMEMINLTKLDLPKAKISIRNNQESTIIDNASDFIKWAEKENKELLKYSEPDIRKTDVKKLIQAGKKLPGVHLERSRSLIIK